MLISRQTVPNTGRGFLSFLGCRPCCGPFDHHICSRESHWLLQAFHEHGHQHPVPQTQHHQQRLLLLPEPHDAGHLGLHPPGLPGRQLRPLCHCQVSAWVARRASQSVLHAFPLQVSPRTRWFTATPRRRRRFEWTSQWSYGAGCWVVIKGSYVCMDWEGEEYK